MAEAEPRYSFDPLERRGVLVGLQPVQLMTVVVTGLLAFVATVALSGHGGRWVAALVVALGVTGAAWKWEGRPVSVWVVETLSWVARRSVGPALDDQPLRGRTSSTVRPRAHAGGWVGRQTRATGPPGVVLEGLASPPGPVIGVAVDRKHGRWSASVPVRGRSFSLLDPADQARRLDGWRVALNSLGRPGTVVSRIQWIERSYPDTSGAALRSLASARNDGAVRSAVSSYEQVLSRCALPQVHEACVVITVSGPADVTSGRGVRAEQVLRRELRLLEGQLRNADLLPAAPLDPGRFAASISALYGREGSCGPSPWPMAEDEQWSFVRSGDSWHATYWIADWPRVDVAPDFLAPLLVAEGRRTVSLIMEPVPPAKAAREARSARTADVADEHLRSRAGFLSSARRDREAEGVLRRETELADGHAEFRFSGYVSVHASGQEELDLACAEAEHAAQAAHVELRRLYGRQREALAWVLPLGRGLR